MFEKFKLKRRIKQCRSQIEALEKKRIRSQAALVEAILRHYSPNDSDVDYFNKYTDQIELVRNEMHELQEKLKTL